MGQSEANADDVDGEDGDEEHAVVGQPFVCCLELGLSLICLLVAGELGLFSDEWHWHNSRFDESAAAFLDVHLLELRVLRLRSSRDGFVDLAGGRSRSGRRVAQGADDDRQGFLDGCRIEQLLQLASKDLPRRQLGDRLQDSDVREPLVFRLWRKTVRLSTG